MDGFFILFYFFIIESGKSSPLLDGSSGFVLTYEDKDGDWMLAGDVPWVYDSPRSVFSSS